MVTRLQTVVENIFYPEAFVLSCGAVQLYKDCHMHTAQDSLSAFPDIFETSSMWINSHDIETVFIMR